MTVYKGLRKRSPVLPKLVLALISTLAASLVISQVIWPALRGKTLFPLITHWAERSRLAKARNAQMSAELNRETVRREVKTAHLNLETEQLRESQFIVPEKEENVD